MCSGGPHLRVADIDVGKTILVAGDGQVRAVVIDAEMDQVVDVEIGLFELCILDGSIEVFTIHGLEAVESRGTGSPQTTRLEDFNRARDEANVQVIEGKRGSLNQVNKGSKPQLQKKKGRKKRSK